MTLLGRNRDRARYRTDSTGGSASDPPVAPRVLLVVENVALARDHRLRKQASSLRAAGYDVTVICRRDPANRQLPGVRVLDYPAPPDAESRISFLWEYGYSWVMAAALSWWAWLTRPFALIQVSGTPDVYVALALPFRWLGATIVLDQRDLSPEVYVARYGGAGGPLHRLLLLCERLSFRTADHVVTVNKTLCDVVRERGGRGPDAVTLVGNGPRLSRLHAAASAAPRPVERSGGRCCWVGVMGRQDGVDLAIRALAHLVHDHGRTGLRCTFIGDGDQRGPAEQLAGELGIAANVTFTGWLPEDEVFAHLQAADIGLEPNLEPVVSPVKVMEYMASGLPFVAFDLAETRVLGGASGAYVPPGDVVAFAAAVDGLLADPALRARMGDAGRDAVRERVAWEHQESAYLSLVSRLLASRLPARRTA